MAKALMQPYAYFKKSRRDKLARLLEKRAATGIAQILGPMLPLERLLKRGLSKADRKGQGFFVPTPYVVSKLYDQLMTDLSISTIKLRLFDWIRWGSNRLHIDTRFIGSGDWSTISTLVKNLPVTREAQQIYQKGLDYRKTAVHARYMERSRNGNPVTRNHVILANEKLISEYFERFVGLFQSIQTNGLLRRKEFSHITGLSRPSQIRNFHLESGEMEIGIAIGRRGEIYRLPGGQHRTAIALALGLKRLPVQVRLVHAEWAAKRWKEHGGKISEAIIEGIQREVKRLSSLSQWTPPK